MQRSPDAHAAPRPYGSGDESVRWMWRAAGGALAGVLVPLLIVHYGWGARALIEAFTACVLLALATVDLERRIIPNRIVLPATALVLAAQLVAYPHHAIEWIAASAGTALFLLMPSVARPGALGMGDVKLGLLLGVALGRHVITALLVGFFALWPLAFFLFLRHGAAVARKTAVPLGPFLAAGAVAAMFLT